jgi:hypothetical protein
MRKKKTVPSRGYSPLLFGLSFDLPEQPLHHSPCLPKVLSHYGFSFLRFHHTEESCQGTKRPLGRRLTREIPTSFRKHFLYQATILEYTRSCFPRFGCQPRNIPEILHRCPDLGIACHVIALQVCCSVSGNEKLQLTILPEQLSTLFTDDQRICLFGFAPNIERGLTRPF